ncbi:FecR family protein [Pedobacter faecalis]|uniref:FecR family protein n=1 Tax=Pedobacter faecalis TaxID=3041495 RepID=UPI00254B509D|nr:FecR domain-containing protein [Pedobacter sp. ELA7]
MPNKSELEIAVLRHLNDPEDTALKNEVDRLRAISIENDHFYQDYKSLWQASEHARRLEGLSKDAVVNFQHKLGEPGNHVGIRHFAWIRVAAAVIILTTFGLWVYNRNTAAVYLTKETSAQIDSIRLSDGSLVALAPHTALSYPQEFEDNHRQVELLRGKAFFKVAKDTRRPFEIAIRSAQIKVLGTSFNINYDTSKIELAVKTGRVMFRPNSKSSSSILGAGEGIKYDYAANTIQAQNGSNANAWITRELHFVDMPMDEVCKQLSDYYGKNIVLHDSIRNIKKFNARFKDVSLNDALNLLRETYPIQIEQHGETIIIKNLN